MCAFWLHFVSIISNNRNGVPHGGRRRLAKMTISGSPGSSSGVVWSGLVGGGLQSADPPTSQ